MYKLGIFWDSSNSKDILLLDKISERYLKRSFGNYSWISLNTRDCIDIAPFKLLNSIKIFLKNSHKLKLCNFENTKKKNKNILLYDFIFFLKIIKYYCICICNISLVLHFKPKLLITNTDNSYVFQLLDAIISHRIPFITIQNGNRWHYFDFINNKNFKHFYSPPSYHSCFATLSNIDILRYKKSNWKCDEFHNIGSLKADLAYEKSNMKNIFDLCVIANTYNCRKSEKKLAELLFNFQENKNLRICVALKFNAKHIQFQSHYEEIFDLYGKFAYIIPSNFKNFNLFCCSEVILGTFSTALRDIFSLGKKIYPINFDFDDNYSYIKNLNINLSPSQKEFDEYLELLLSMDKLNYKKKYEKEINFIGTLPQDKSPSKRLEDLINQKIKSNYF